MDIPEIKLDNNQPKLGYYLVGNNKHFSKTYALMEATRTNQFPEWHFNRDVFNNIDWTVEPKTDLRTLYRIRAQQLRDKYDYLRLEFSGGSDSVTVAYTFLLNNIHLDEIVFRYPKSGDKNFSNNPFDTRSENSLSEWEFAAKPILQWISDNYPKVKITMHDYAQDMLTKKYDESHFLTTREYIQPQHSFKHDQLATLDQKLLADKDKSICVIYGVDKPKLCIKDRKWYAYFMDLNANHGNPIQSEYNNITTEYFFWQPDLPELVVKQAHIIRNWFMLPQNQFLQHLVRWPNHMSQQRTAYENIIKPLIYEDYDHTTFQCAKPTNNFYSEMDYWFFENFKNTRAYDIWNSALTQIIGQIDDKYFNIASNKKVGFVGFLSPFYYLGESTYIDSGKNAWSKF